MLSYLGAHYRFARGVNSLAQDVVFRLLDGLLNKGYNVTMDNFFTSPSLASELLHKQTTMVGTVRQNRKGLPTPVIVDEYNSVKTTRY